VAARSAGQLADALGFASAPPLSAAEIGALTTDWRTLSLERKVLIAAYMARRGRSIDFGPSFQSYCRSDGYAQIVHCINVELFLLQRALVGDKAIETASVGLPNDIAALHAVAVAQDPFLCEDVSVVLGPTTDRVFSMSGPMI
jgi:hypothetical protein